MPLPGELAELADRVRNWGRWGDDDELGTANLLDDAAARRGAAAVRSGRRSPYCCRVGSACSTKALARAGCLSRKLASARLSCI